MTNRPQNGNQNLANTGNCYGKTRPSLARLADLYERGLVSIIIPCFNNAQFVGEAIESALNQQYEPKEIIVIDDGSDDECLAIIKEYNERIIWRTKKNAGASAARNDALEIARGEFIQFLDADDVLAPNSISKRLEKFGPEVDAVFGDMQEMDEDGRLSGRTVCHNEWHPLMNMAEYVVCKNIHTPLPLHRRQNLYMIGGFDEALPRGQELNFHIRLVVSGHHFIHLPLIVAYRRVHSNQSRLTNMEWWKTNPTRQLTILENNYNIYRRHNLHSETICQVIARSIWKEGVFVGSMSSFDLAKEHFSKALEIAPAYYPRNPIRKFFAMILGRVNCGCFQCMIGRCKLKAKNISARYK